MPPWPFLTKGVKLVLEGDNSQHCFMTGLHEVPIGQGGTFSLTGGISEADCM